MIRVLFVCHGNICRSPMAEFIMKDLVEKAGLEGEFQIASAATSMEEYGNPIYPPARRKLQEHGISLEGHRARRMERRDYQDYDYLIGMEHYNIRNMLRIVGGDPEGKISRLLDFTDAPGISTIPGTRTILIRRTGKFCGDAGDFWNIYGKTGNKWENKENGEEKQTMDSG